jgi:formylglycine-generating enzyme required for sulfatase activity
MEYVHGASLARLMTVAAGREHGVPPAIAATIVAGALQGLHAAHTASADTGERLDIIHRDVSPQNVLVGADGVARIGDFGVARAGRRVHTTQQGKIPGKLPYMAPEQLLARRLDGRTDVYAAAVVLWEALTGRRLFEGDDDTALIDEILRGEVRRPKEVRPSVPDALDAIVMKGLSREPNDRFDTALQMALAVEACGLAPSSEVGACVRRLVGEELGTRSRRIAQIESEVAADSMQKAIDVIERLRSPALGLDSREHDDLDGRVNRAPTEANRSAVDPDDDDDENRTTVPLQKSVASPVRSRRGMVVACAVLGAAALVAAAVVFAAPWRVFQRKPPASAPPRVADSALAVQAPTSAGPVPSAPVPVDRCAADMIAIPAGNFFMGQDDGPAPEAPAHQVRLDAYCMDRTEVTVATYVTCIYSGDCKRFGTTNAWPDIKPSERSAFDPLCNGRDPIGRAQHPINCVDWEAAQHFCVTRGKRLPTEAEWEFAARGPDGRPYPWGDEPPTAAHLNGCGRECAAWGKAHHVEEHAMYQESDGFATTAPVGSFPRGRSPFGLDDTAGNVWEWVSDRYGPYGAKEETNPRGAEEGDERVIRGGAWNAGEPAWARPTFRYKRPAGFRSYGIGFRCAADVH